MTLRELILIVDMPAFQCQIFHFKSRASATDTDINPLRDGFHNSGDINQPEEQIYIKTGEQFAPVAQGLRLLKR
jgi:hypothetical protein